MVEFSTLLRGGGWGDVRLSSSFSSSLLLVVEDSRLVVEVPNTSANASPSEPPVGLSSLDARAPNREIAPSLASPRAQAPTLETRSDPGGVLSAVKLPPDSQSPGGGMATRRRRRPFRVPSPESRGPSPEARGRPGAWLLAAARRSLRLRLRREQTPGQVRSGPRYPANAVGTNDSESDANGSTTRFAERSRPPGECELMESWTQDLFELSRCRMYSTLTPAGDVDDSVYQFRSNMRLATGLGLATSGDGGRRTARELTASVHGPAYVLRWLAVSTYTAADDDDHHRPRRRRARLVLEARN